MSDAAPAIFNGLSHHYPDMKKGMCYFHVMKNMKERHYTNDKTKKEFLNDIRSLSKSHSQEHFDASVTLFLAKYKSEKDILLLSAVSHLQKVWLVESNRGWHSGVVPGTVTTNNGLEVTNRIFKKKFEGNFFHCFVILEQQITYYSSVDYNIGDLVSGTECLQYTFNYVEEESLYRTKDNNNFKEFSFVPRNSNDITNMALSLAKYRDLVKLRPTILRKQYLMLKEDRDVADIDILKMINKSNRNSFSSWEEREDYFRNVRVISPLSQNRSLYSSSVYECTCQTYLDEYECEHTLAICVANNMLPESRSMHLPLGLKRGPGRPSKAVKGALNRQKIPEKKSKYEDLGTISRFASIGDY